MVGLFYFVGQLEGWFYQDKSMVGLAKWYGWGSSLDGGTQMMDKWNNRGKNKGKQQITQWIIYCNKFKS